MRTTSALHILPLQSKVGTMSTKSSKNVAYEMLVAQKDVITKITGIITITPESIDTLKNELRGAFTILNSTHHFVDGQPYGFLASMIPQDKYWIVISVPADAHAGNKFMRPKPLPLYNSKIANDALTVVCVHANADHKSKLKDCANYDAAKQGCAKFLHDVVVS
jgi:hypothetical protein